jgi:hypothetical protein
VNSKDFLRKPLVRWTLGPCHPDGIRCLCLSIAKFQKLYDAEIVICFNCVPELIPEELKRYRLIDQNRYSDLTLPKPIGVAWKLYPPRLAPDRHELFIDNDLILADPVPQLEAFFTGDHTLLLEETGRTYGRFESHVPQGFCINSGLFGLPPGFDLRRFIDFYVTDDWEQNAIGEHAKSITWDEQGLVALALLSYARYNLIPKEVVSNCEHELIQAKGFHFIGLNRRDFHRPFRLYNSSSVKIHL